jgi:hypothetical protein
MQSKTGILTAGDRIPCLANINHVDTIWTRLPQVWLHVNLEILGPKMALRCKQHLNILGSGIEDRGKIRRRHD